MTRVLVVCPDKTGPLMAGTAIRSVEIARALAAECDVTLAVPDGSVRVALDLPQVRVPGESRLPPLVAAAECVLVSGRAELMTAIRTPLVVDLYDPFILSDLEFYGPRFTAAGGRPLLALRWLQHHLAYGDLFLCASDAQRSFWLGMLAAAGRMNRANYVADASFASLLAVVPFGIPSAPPVPSARAVKGVIPGIGAGDKVVLWAGGLWNWFDPLTLLRALVRLRAERPEVKAVFLGVRHPNPDIGAMAMADRAVALARELDLLDRGAFFVDWVPYDERQNYLLESDVAVSLHQPGIEAQFAFRTRVLDYLWCGLPMVLSRGDELAARVEREGLGVAVPEGDEGAVAAAIARLLDAPAPADRPGRLAALRGELAWDRVVEPLRRFCRAPRLAADKLEGGWFTPDAEPAAVVHKEDALVAEELLATERELSPPLGRHYVVEHRFTATYDNLCRIDVLPWVSAPPPAVDVVLTLDEEGPHGRRVARVTAPLGAVAHNDWHRFELRPVANSRGRRYRLAIEVPGTTASGVSLWLCRTGTGELTPALVLHYLIKGLVEELPVDAESFLFLHNTTVSDALVPGVGAAAADTASFAASLVAAPAPAPAPPPGGDHAADTVRAELARVAAELAVTRRELAATSAQAAAAAQARVLPRLVRELARGALRAARAGLGLAGAALVAVLVVLSVPLALALAVALAAADAWTALRRGARARGEPAGAEPSATVRPAGAAGAPAPAGPRSALPVSVVIPTWNGRGLLDMSLPPLRAALAAHAPGGEIVVVDNGSTDGTCAHLATAYPEVRVVALGRNEGFAGAANRGARESRHPTLILLNNDMVVEPDFIAPLLRAFDDDRDVFGVSCQIDFIDKTKPRWETGKVHARWKNGTITLFHLDHWEDGLLYPVFFAGGGASAYDRAKFLALDGFDEAVFRPVYIEDVDLGYRAWMRGWPSLFAPGSLVHHKHRGTTRRLWSEGTIYAFFVKNLAALVWKNVGDWRLLGRHLAGLVVLAPRVRRHAGTWAAVATIAGLARQLPRAVRARVRQARVPRRLDDATIFRVSRHRYVYRARLGRRPPRPPGARPRVLVVSPYSPYPPVHGGAVRMLALLERVAPHADVTLLSFGDTPAELDPRSLAELRRHCREAVVLERDTAASGGILDPAKTRGFFAPAMADSLEYFLDREDYDVVQVEYTHMAHFIPPPAPGLRRVLVEHDVSFVSLARARAAARGRAARLAAWLEWMRMLRYEIGAVERADLVLTMSETDRALLGRFADARHVVPVPNGVDCHRFPFAAGGREPESILFVGFFRHEPNVEAVRYFCREVLPLVRHTHPGARFRIVGAYPPEIVRRLADTPGIEVTGRVDDIGAYYRRSAVFVAPVLQGSGTRLKILEAMASGCPVVSTTVGAEGIDAADGEHLLLADTPEAMAAAIDGVLREPGRGAALAARARALVAARYDWDRIAAQLLACWRAAPGQDAGGAPAEAARPVAAARG